MLVPWTTVVLAFNGAAALSAVLFAMALRNPRLMLQDYPKDVQAAVPPKTAAERRETVGWGVLFLLLLLGTPLAAAVTAKLQQPGLSFGGGFLNAFLGLLVFNLVDWLILDWLVFCTLTPRFVNGYDLMFKPAPGRSESKTFKADKTGSFDIEIEDRNQHLGELEVLPR